MISLYRESWLLPAFFMLNGIVIHSFNFACYKNNNVLLFKLDLFKPLYVTES